MVGFARYETDFIIQSVRCHFNYFYGMMSGVVFAITLGLIFTDVSAVNSFPLIMLASAIASVLACLWTEPDDEEILVTFYSQIRPWGFWQPIYEKVVARDPSFRKNTQAGRDLSNVFVGIIWQTSLRLIPVFLIVFRTTAMWVAIGLAAVTTVN